jgi:thioredoxin 1
MPLPVIEDIPTQKTFEDLLTNNPGLVIIKCGAVWCSPCRKIEPEVKKMVEYMPNNVQMVIIDIDQSLDFYSFLKKKRVLNGVPVILCYKRGNTSFIPDDYVVGASIEKVNQFAERCYKTALSM